GNTRLPGVVHFLDGLCFNGPIYDQYGCYLKNVFATWPPYFGPSYGYFPISASSIAIEALPWTLLLIIPALLATIGITTALAKINALKNGSKSESLLNLIGRPLFVIPAFWIAMLIFWAYFMKPEISNPPFTVDSSSSLYGRVIIRYLLAFSSLMLATYGQVYVTFKRGFDQVTKSEYVRASKMRGLGNNVIMPQYVLSNSLLRLLSSSIPLVGAVISADILVEATFGYGGLGMVVAGGVLARDYPLLMASLFYIVILAIGISLCCDLIRMKLDPRLRHGEEMEPEEAAVLQNAI
ncbi:MAG: ABC transporter permease subunit, partial [Nitrososphaerales archaeon]